MFDRVKSLLQVIQGEVGSSPISKVTLYGLLCGNGKDSVLARDVLLIGSLGERRVAILLIYTQRPS